MLTVAVNLTLFLALEFGLRRLLPLQDAAFLLKPIAATPLPTQAEAQTEYVDFAQNHSTIRCQTSLEHMERISPDDVDPDDFNIFLLGGSALWGVGLPWEAKFNTLLAKHFSAQDRVRVFNCALQAITSREVAANAFALLKHFDVDLLIIYSGNNEFISWFYPIEHRIGDFSMTKLSEALSSLYIYRGLLFVQRLFHSDFPFHRLDPKTVDYWRFIDSGQCLDRRFTDLTGYDPRRYAETRSQVLSYYENNLRLLVRQADEKKVPVILTTVPFHPKLAVCYFLRQPLAIHSGKQNEQRLAQQLHQAWELINRGELEAALKLALTVQQIEPEAPLPYYIQAQALEKQGRILEAKEAYTQARQKMFGYLGSIQSINEIVVKVAEEEKAYLSDIRGYIEEQNIDSKDPLLLGSFLDYCHLSAGAMRQAVDQTAKVIKRQGLVNLDVNALPD